MATVRAILFDAGGVILRENSTGFLSEVERRLGLKSPLAPARLVSFDKGMNLGKISVKEMLSGRYAAASEKEMQKLLEIWGAAWPLARTWLHFH
jgi:hypothetical protein